MNDPKYKTKRQENYRKDKTTNKNGRYKCHHIENKMDKDWSYCQNQ